jgi:hypothetical protein
MNTDQHIWRVWASFLQRWGVEDMLVALLEAAGPLNILGAQVVYLGQPLMGRALPKDHLDALSRVLEDTSQMRAFVAYLREEPSSESV